MLIWFFKRERSEGWLFSNLGQIYLGNLKKTAQESCLCGIIDVRLTLFLSVWFIVLDNSIILYPVRGYLFFEVENNMKRGFFSDISRERFSKNC